jgi:hypothetical protein
MSDPFRLRVLKALTAQLQTITPDNPDFTYHFDVSQNVFRGRSRYGDEDPLPLISILEPPLAIERVKSQPDNSDSTGEWDLLIQGWAEDDPANPTDPAYTLVADVLSCLAQAKLQKQGRTSNIFGLGAGFGSPSGILDMRLGAPVVRPPDETSAKSCFYLIVTLQIAEDNRQPFG